MGIDLHTHTTASDGSFSPTELVDLAVSQGVQALAITDHDAIEGVKEALPYAADKKITVVAGVELSIDYPLKGQAHLHLLGLFLDLSDKKLQKELDRLARARLGRARRILEKLKDNGYPIDEPALWDTANMGSIGRPHIAKMLIEKGYARDVKQSFKKYLSKGGLAYVSKEKLKIQPAIDLIHHAGGLAILAHPISLHYKRYPRYGQEILKLKDMGLDGIEVYYPSHDRYFTRWLYDFALQHDLAVSGGSDFHGTAKPDIKLGRGFGNLDIPWAVYEHLKKRV